MDACIPDGWQLGFYGILSSQILAKLNNKNSVSQKKIPWHFFPNGWEAVYSAFESTLISSIVSYRIVIFNQFFTHLLYVPFYTRLQIFIQLSPTLTKLCHIKCEYLVHIICAKCPKCAKTCAFRRLHKSLIALLIDVCGKWLWNKHFYNVNKHVRYDMTLSVMSFAQ